MDLTAVKRLETEVVRLRLSEVGLAIKVKQLEDEILRLKLSKGHTSARSHYSSEEWKKSFKVGDILSGWATSKRVKVIAIGRDRFLWVDIRTNYEGVSKMAGHAWAKSEDIETASRIIEKRRENSRSR